MTIQLFKPVLRAAPALALAAMAVLSGCAVQGPRATSAEFHTAAAAPVALPQLPKIVAPRDPADVAAEPRPPLIDPVRPEVIVETDTAAARMDLWERVRRGFAIPDLDTDLVHGSEQWYIDRPDYVARMTERSSRYLFHITEEIERRGMPSELALLPFIESAFNPQAMSTAKASGMWQFIPSTGRDFSLKQNMFRDDRRDVLASTRAALDYLDRLHTMFGDWHLALAAYNWGEGNVQRAIAKNQKAGLPTDYLSLRMPDETRGYVPKLQAVKNIIAHPEVFGITLPVVDNHPYFLSVPIERDIDVSLAARLAGLTNDEFKQLNPQMNHPVILAAGTPQVLLPYDNATRFADGVGAYRGPMATWTAWVAPKTQRTSDVAQQLGISEDQLRSVNRIPPRMLVKAGSTLLVPRSDEKQDDVSEHVADTAVMSLSPDVPPPVKISARAGKKDTLASIAHRYKTNAAQLARWNNLSPNARLSSGQALVLFVPAGSAAARQASAPQPSEAVASSSRAKGSKQPAMRVAKSNAKRTVTAAAPAVKTVASNAKSNTKSHVEAPAAKTVAKGSSAGGRLSVAQR
ncbi:MAG: putative rane-bound lytic murein transglycosylase [Rhizobacter sp.]|nr:putative rane-bound lytic murein transglycosylase [Rhizobacter sp.]